MKSRESFDRHDVLFFAGAATLFVPAFVYDWQLGVAAVGLVMVTAAIAGAA